MNGLEVDRRRLRLLVFAAGAVVLVVMTAGIAFLIGGGEPAGRAVSPAGAPTRPVATPSTGGAEPAVALARTADADVFARVVAAVVLGMDTRSRAADGFRQVLRAAADPLLSDTGRADLYATIDSRIPSDAMWERMRANGQRSVWAPTRSWEPAAWSQVVTGGYAEPGWAMRDVSGIQTTQYVQAGVVRSSARQLTLTVVMRCPAAGTRVDHCGLVLIATQPIF